jgi:hypothetical protein
MVSSIGSSYNPLQQLLSQLVSKNDSNADGKLDGTEMQSLLGTLQANGTGSGLTADQVIGAFDTDGDGAVSGAEFDAKFRKLTDGLQGNLLALQEDGQTAAAPSGPQGAGHRHGHHHGGGKPEDSESVLSNLLDISDQDSDAADDTADSSGDLVQSFLARLNPYAQGSATGQPGSSLSESA